MSDIPLPLLKDGMPVDWWFAFKFNSKWFEGCGNGAKLPPKGLFGGDYQPYDSEGRFSLQYVVARRSGDSILN